MIKRSTYIVLTALIFSAGPSVAQQIDSPYDFVDRSMAFWAFGSAVFTDRGLVDVGPGSGFAGGLGFTARVSGPFNVDARVAYFPTSRRVYDLVEADSALLVADPMEGLELVGTADLSLLLLEASLRFDITGPRTWYRLQPYALIGVGGVLGVSSEHAAEEDIDPAADLRVRFRNGITGHVGGGVEWYATRRITLRADARDVLWQVHVPEGFLADGRVIDLEQWVQTAHLSLGLSFRF